MSIDGSTLQFEWKTATGVIGKIIGGPAHWDLVVVVLGTDKPTNTDADGNETPWPIMLQACVINASFEGQKYGSAEILSPPASIEHYEQLIRESPAVEEAVNNARGNLQGHMNKAMWKHGITPQPE